RAQCLLQGRPSSWCSTFPGARRTRETWCSPWEGGAPARPGGLPEGLESAARPPIELVVAVSGVQTYPRDSVLALGGRSTSSSTRQPESSVSAARPPHRAGARRSRGPDVPERLGARPGRDEHQLVHPYAIWRATPPAGSGS